MPVPSPVLSDAHAGAHSRPLGESGARSGSRMVCWLSASFPPRGPASATVGQMLAQAEG